MDKVILREWAIQLGLKRYTGKPCKSCGGTERIVNCRSCACCMNARASRRRVKLKGNGGRHSGREVLDLFHKQGKACAYCRQRLTLSSMHKDHIIPVVAGGSDNIWNIQILCPPCNLKKGIKIMEISPAAQA